MLKNIIFIALGGGLGSVLRYLSNIYIGKFFPNKGYIATLFANMIGCLLIGILVGYFIKNHSSNEAFKLLLITGFCGGFTTFSTFGLENYNLLQSQNYILTLSYIILSITIGIAFVGLGIYLTK
ncbi:putative fluoride ion transporter CrcB [Flavobacterium sp. 9AF]|uniref:fluoride efflux transporter CrcB n=1 Tax=Flavobacterium sp. 9AF TaxID=2653142 RepID=UPI0012F442E0|nr:fluoride efflux transporter CrcB [Flavobacterium sp. 9AF]VXC21054.1 putative fluoride ion transporter CrcB [Flavobacterium sp. 9AF]